MKNYKFQYIISSIRNCSDEQNIQYGSNDIYCVGDELIIDGIKWYVDEIVSRNPDNAYESLIIFIIDECGYSMLQADSIVSNMIDDGAELTTDNVWSYMARYSGGDC